MIGNLSRGVGVNGFARFGPACSETRAKGLAFMYVLNVGMVVVIMMVMGMVVTTA